MALKTFLVGKDALASLPNGFLQEFLQVYSCIAARRGVVKRVYFCPSHLYHHLAWQLFFSPS